MDKYEFNIKVEQIRKLSNQGDFETAMKIADTIDWKKVRNANLLSMVANVYEKNHEYQDAKDILLMAFERAPIGKRLLYKLTDLALKEGNVEEANAYYREFCDLAGDDPRQHLLRYMILKAMRRLSSRSILWRAIPKKSWMKNGCTSWQSCITVPVMRSAVWQPAIRSC